MEFAWTLIFLGGVALSVDAVYQDVQYRKERKLELNKRFYPLDFNKADAYHIMKDTQDLIKLHTYNVFNSNNLLKYKISKKISPKTRKSMKEEWIITDVRDQSELAIICIGSPFHKHFVQFPMINKYRDHQSLELSSSTSHEQAELQAATSPIVSNIQNFQHIPTAISSSGTTRLDTINVTPYIDSSLVQNRSITQNELGSLEIITNNDDLHKYEVQKLSKIFLRITKRFKSSNFKISKNSMIYSWKSNGYLEKQSKNLLDSSSERIGMIRFNNKRGDDYWIYINDERIDPLISITTAFLHQKLSLWDYKKLTII
ncbi:putative secreted protein [Wickerhamomyces ciferrii]|uniref:Secreted protein n=1 Tax=Wickerhamomyces ciferrii (strain ATCC 14091 / BCRC 22168 / CBS 111 / JCM 3599 / NBRC 0793 / NRRL Y-1031 F-60-10) TaxID=1206466 RepID=K0KKH8_WICCF|nr:uncharacterized protein BN7_2206 [Wickerhamomyces ciferrii]CCH42662.1 putative secreted protein [Wickerhamomyces ciferrii]